MEAVNLLGLDRDALGAYVASLDEKPFRARQLMRWIHRRGAAEFDAMSDLAKSLRAKLAGRATIAAPAVLRDGVSSDGTRKWLLDVGKGDAIETVFIPEDDRGTLCVSSQAGCAVNCVFCSTGKQGFSRNLSTAEIVGQLWWAEHTLRRDAAPQASTEGERIISNVVLMGMGEPLQNYDAVLPALAFDARRRRLRPVAPPRHALDLRHGAADRSSGAGLPGGARRLAARAERRVARPAGAPQPQVSAARAARGLPALSARRAARLHHFRVRDARGHQRQRSRRRASSSPWCAMCPASST